MKGSGYGWRGDRVERRLSLSPEPAFARICLYFTRHFVKGKLGDREVHFHAQPLVSVVTPVYNGEPYLAECIESILNQTYQNWEYTIVNNCSTDRSLDIAQYYANKDQRIRVYNNNVFLEARKNFNHSIRKISAKSTYCKIVQADDWIFPECLGLMVKVAENNPSVGIVGAYRLDDKQVSCTGLPYQRKVFPGKEVCKLSLLGGPFVFGSPTSILFRSDIVRNRDPFYSENSVHEDTEACYEILQNWDFGFVHQVLTYTRRENESISTTVRQFDPYHLLDKFIVVYRYGRYYLSQSEYEKCFKNAENVYYHFLAKGLLSRSKRELLQYHREGLKTIGYQIYFSKLYKYTFLVILVFLLDPKRIIERMSRKLKNLWTYNNLPKV